MTILDSNLEMLTIAMLEGHRVTLERPSTQKGNDVCVTIESLLIQSVNADATISLKDDNGVLYAKVSFEKVKVQLSVSLTDLIT
jgi:hypothetical protein